MSLDRAAIATARAQLGLLSRRQAFAIGFRTMHIDHRLRSGRWERVLPGVYRIGGAPDSWRQRLMAAVLWAGEGAAISHRSAARLLSLDGVREDLVEVSIAARVKSPAEWLLLHHPQTLPSDEIEEIEGIRVTGAARTILDLGAVLPRWRVEVALDGALRDGHVEHKDLRRTLQRHGARGRDGTASLRYLLVERDPDYVPPESSLERIFIPILGDPRLPEAVRQYPIMRDGKIVYRIDFAYPQWKLAIEIDSYRHHHSRQSWHKDKTRSNEVVAQGWRMLRLTKEDAASPGHVVETVLRALRGAGYRF